MPFMRSVAAELPYLRRYARAVTGASDLGDAAVRETLMSGWTVELVGSCLPDFNNGFSFFKTVMSAPVRQ